MLKYEVTSERFTFVWNDPDTVKGFRESKVGGYLMDAQTKLMLVADCVCSHSAKVGQGSYIGLVATFRRITDLYRTSSPPEADDAAGWNRTLLSHYEATLQNRSIAAKTRTENWNAIALIYKELKRKGGMPQRAKIPSNNLNSRFRKSQPQPPLGHEEIPIPPAKNLNETLPKKFLIEPDLTLDDDAFLFKLKSDLQRSAQGVTLGCIEYWHRMRNVHAIGKSLIDEISEEDIQKAWTSGNYVINGVHLVDPASPKALCWFLALAKHAFLNDDVKLLTWKELSKLPFMKGLGNDRLDALKALIRKAHPVDDINSKHITEYMIRLMGFLSAIDCSAACAILIAENPIYNAESMHKSDLYMANGAPYLLIDTENGRARFSVKKARAKARKSSYLSKLSRTIIHDVIECTTEVREKLIRQKNKNWKRLFITVSKKMNNGSSTIGRIYPKGMLFDRIQYDIKHLELLRSNFNLKSIRATQGLIIYLTSGSLVLTSNVLGNTVRVVKSNYIPEWLIQRMSNRTMRILQQKLIIVSTAGQPWMQIASDSLTEEELGKFVIIVLNGAVGSDPFSVAARKRLGSHSAANSSVPKAYSNSLEEMGIHAAPETLALLYSYAQHAKNLPQRQQQKIIPHTDVTPEGLIHLVGLIQGIAELDHENASAVELAIAINFIGDSSASLMSAHRQAQEMVNDCSAHISKVLIKSKKQWCN